MEKRDIIPPTMLRTMLLYKPLTGCLFWRQRPVELFLNIGAARRWNTRWAGVQAFITEDGRGYLQGRLFTRSYYAHRVAWAIATGAWPVDQIDHINGNRADNRIENLREVSHVNNCRNVKTPENNTSGVMGVYWRKDRRKWRAQIKLNGRNCYLGYFTDFASAVAARCAAESKYGYHANHGRIIRPGSRADWRARRWSKEEGRFVTVNRRTGERL